MKLFAKDDIPIVFGVVVSILAILSYVIFIRIACYVGYYLGIGVIKIQ